jgi:hypothetical protein
VPALHGVGAGGPDDRKRPIADTLASGGGQRPASAKKEVPNDADLGKALFVASMRPAQAGEGRCG